MANNVVDPDTNNQKYDPDTIYETKDVSLGDVEVIKNEIANNSARSVFRLQ